MIVDVPQAVCLRMARTRCSTFAINLNVQVGLPHLLDVRLAVARSFALVENRCHDPSVGVRLPLRFVAHFRKSFVVVVVVVVVIVIVMLLVARFVPVGLVCVALLVRKPKQG